MISEREYVSVIEGRETYIAFFDLGLSILFTEFNGTLVDTALPSVTTDRCYTRFSGRAERILDSSCHSTLGSLSIPSPVVGT